MSINVNIKVSGAGGTTFPLGLQLSNTILDVKNAAKDICPVEPDEMKIILKGRILKDTDTIEMLQVENGSTLHIVKSAPTAVADVLPSSTESASLATSAAAGVHAGPSATMPGSLASRQARLENMQGGAADEQAGAMNSSLIAETLDNPLVQQLMQNFAESPDRMQQMIRSNPVLQGMSQRDPEFGQMISDPQVMQRMMKPDTLRGIVQMQQALGTTQSTTSPTLDPPLLHAAMQAMAANGPRADGEFDSPSREQFSSQLAQLTNMGFPDRLSNLEALQKASGDVNSSIKLLLGQQCPAAST